MSPDDLLAADRAHVWHPYAPMPGTHDPLVVREAGAAADRAWAAGEVFVRTTTLVIAAILLGGVFATLAGIVFGVPSLRVRGHLTFGADVTCVGDVDVVAEHPSVVPDGAVLSGSGADVIEAR